MVERLYPCYCLLGHRTKEQVRRCIWEAAIEATRKLEESKNINTNAEGASK